MDEYLFQSLPYDVVYQLLANLINSKGKTTQTRPSGTPAVAQPKLVAPSDSGSGGAGPGQGTGEFGPLEGQTKSMMGNISSARSVASTLNSIAASLFGASLPGLGMVGVGGPLTAVNLASTIASLLGMPSGYDPSLGLATPSDIQSINDLQGAFAARAAADQAMADYADRVAAFSGPIATEAWGPAEIAGLIGGGYADPGTFGGFGSNSLAGGRGSERGNQSTATIGGPAPSVTNPDSPFGASDFGQTERGGVPGDPDSRDQGGRDANSTAGDTSSSPSEGSRGTEGSDRKRGGVFRASRPKTERITWGERGTAPGGKSGETAIFIPDRMQLPGLQENEALVRRALRRNLMSLLADRRARSTR